MISLLSIIFCYKGVSTPNFEIEGAFAHLAMPLVSKIGWEFSICPSDKSPLIFDNFSILKTICQEKRCETISVKFPNL